jgi:hypothetical protein
VLATSRSGLNFWLSPPPSRRMQFEVLGLLAVLAGYAAAFITFARLS